MYISIDKYRMNQEEEGELGRRRGRGMEYKIEEEEESIVYNNIIIIV